MTIAPTRRHPRRDSIATGLAAVEQIKQQRVARRREQIAAREPRKCMDDRLGLRAIGQFDQIAADRGLANAVIEFRARGVKTLSDRIGLLPFKPRRAALHQPFAGAKADAADIFFGQRGTDIGRTANQPQQPVVRAIVALRHRARQQITDRSFIAGAADQLRNRLMEERQIVGANPHALIEPQPAIIDAVEQRERDPEF